MKITQSNVRSVVLQALLLIFLAVLRAKADDSQLTKRDYFHNLPTLDPIPAQTVSTTFGDNNGKDSTTTTITATKSKKSTTTTATTITSFTALASIANDPETSTTTSSSLILTNTPLTNTTNQYTNTSDPLVQYDLECRADVLFCNKVSEAVGAAIDEFTRVINVKNSLLIKVKYYSFCEKTCANDTFGWGSPTSQFTLPFEDGADLNYVYPQALAKQLAPYSSTSVWSKYDIEIEINHDVYLNSTDVEQALQDGWNGTGTPSNGKYWFFNTSSINNEEIESHQVDFRYVVLHELMHGLGFLSSWAAYFWTDASPFRTLVHGVIDPLELQLVTPGPYWFINQDTGPTYVTGFQPTMIFDKYLVNIDTELNITRASPLSDLAFEMQDFCVQNSDAFIINFIKSFNAANQSSAARKLWISMAQPQTLSFQFQPPSVADSSYNWVPYLNQTYRSMTLLTGRDLLSRSSRYEHTDATINRPGLMISHLDNTYYETPDFLMTRQYHTGQTLEQLVASFYKDLPVIKYNEAADNNNNNTTIMVEKTYQSPIGPGILRVLDSIGYSTVLTKTNYTTDGNVKTPKSRSLCDDSNTNHGLKSLPIPTSYGEPSYICNTLLVGLLLLCLVILNNRI